MKKYLGIMKWVSAFVGKFPCAFYRHFTSISCTALLLIFGLGSCTKAHLEDTSDRVYEQMWDIYNGDSIVATKDEDKWKIYIRNADAVPSENKGPFYMILKKGNNVVAQGWAEGSEGTQSCIGRDFWSIEVSGFPSFTFKFVKDSLSNQEQRRLFFLFYNNDYCQHEYRLVRIK